MKLNNLSRRLFADSHIYLAIKVLIAMVGIVVFSIQRDDLRVSVLLSLGVVAAAIAETNDHLPGRVKNLTVTLSCFLLASFSVQYLFPWPWLFALGLAGSTFLFVMVGALGQRYASISFGSLMIAIYTMQGAASAPNLYHQPLLLGAGALWYGVISLMWLMLLPYKTLHEQLAQVYFALGRYLIEKSRLLSLDEHGNQAMCHRLAQLNIQIVQAMNLVRLSLNNRLQHSKNAKLDRLLHLYLLAQDIHERTMSNYYPYHQLKQELKQEQMLIGLQETRLQLGESCQQLGQSILLHTPYQHTPRIRWALQALEDQLAFAHQRQPYPEALLVPLTFLVRNLAGINALLRSAATSPGSAAAPEELLQSVRASWQTLRHHTSLNSMLLRHAMRMSIGLVTGYGLLQALPIERGYWILLTLLLVCQPSYSATRQRLIQRTIGTFVGILLGVPVLLLAPSPYVQLVVMGFAAFLFFTQLRLHDSAAVGFITLYVLMAINLLSHQGLQVVGPRLLDTAIGCLISFALVAWLWPDWQYKRLPALIASSLRANAGYLDQVLATLGKRSESTDYRAARRRAHEADCELALSWQSMLVEPRHLRHLLELCIQLTRHNHALLSYLSTLGAHRAQLAEMPDLPRLRHYLLDMLHSAASQVVGEQPIAIRKQVVERPFNDAAEMSESQRMLSHQLRLIQDQAEQLLTLAHATRRLALPHKQTTQ